MNFETTDMVWNERNT